MKVGIEGLRREPFASIICYPKPCRTELSKRLKELQRLGIEAIEFSGEKEALNLNVLGKGCVGIVVIAYRGQEKLAVKIRRIDADRSRMQQEAKMLKKANSVNVGPKFLGVSKNFLLMQFVEGDLLPKWLEAPRKKVEVKRVLREVLKQCWRLDEAGLDHGELSHAPKHVIVDGCGKPFIVDFETASLNRKPSNVTSICQFLFISGVVAERVAEKLGERDKKVIIEALRAYKSIKSRENFEMVLNTCVL
ncbi:MAG: RIO1 family regulatory kinase/ATPase domain-containing protein [Candidatus Bathycorpusculaceae bacterium]